MPSKENPKIKVDDYWEASKRFLSDHRRFLEELVTFDKDNIPERTMDQIRTRYISASDFNPQRVEKASSAARGICLWILAISDYEKIARVVRPK
mmetsp:Transcript_5393/g.3114  ORF Transcript_5393/g.3114 Transcript_5393/m.3114 type:complete len:94 (-) Transcript_5393:124-405(-)|eukprot:CAMPEP_0201283094 /NCGR_PEP_ID=MMETSP1317-20130820/7585_1 /ASSEMBLY_ACC=CAM_ASM_000770 /TAXON_ID=187299 /ORGANISM="Undescribed Undescribed, Strain Undescribed" /LENGTH=93 /DNA_ID=CAMNT_0047598137 /DNA_START=1598 /DNA_END=1879 /DNA_ORIENTATION=+